MSGPSGVRLGSPAASAVCTAAASPVAEDAPRETHAASTHPGGHRHHAGWHGPTPRNRRSPSPPKPRRLRRSRGTGLSDDEEDLHLPSAESDPLGAPAVTARHEQQDGGDDQHEGGNDRSRHDRTARVRSQARNASHAADGAGLPLSALRLPRNAQRQVEAFLRSVAAVVAQANGRPSAHAADHSAGAGKRPANALRRLMLELLRGTDNVAQLDAGGLRRVRALLLHFFPERLALAGQAGPLAMVLNCTLPLLFLQLQRRRTEHQAALAICKLLALTATR